jgi:hypothetical protein
LACNVLVNRALPLNTSRGPCPFDADACQPGVDSITFDTGLIDVGPSFGLNLPSSDGVKFRRNMTCSVLAINEKFNTLIPYSVTIEGALRTNTSVTPLSLLFNYGNGWPSQIEGTTWALDYGIHYLNPDYSLL